MNAQPPLSADGLEDVNVSDFAPLPSPEALHARQPLDARARATVAAARRAIGEIIDGRDPRLLVVVGPCSIHDLDGRGTTRAASARCPRNSPSACCW